jgi:glutathione S-transferase
MTYDLYIGDRSFSSWSMRGWLMFSQFDIPCKIHMVGLYSGTMERDLAQLAPARLVPVMRTPEGTVIGDTLAMAETLAERHPDAGLWPAKPEARALARWLVSEMHSGFNSLRAECPMQLLYQHRGFVPSKATLRDIERVQELWTLAQSSFGSPEGWLFGRYSLADVFYAPIAARIAGYGLNVSVDAATYVARQIGSTRFRQWRAMGLTKSYDPIPYALDLPQAPWPGPALRDAQAVDSGPSVNSACPYSGKEVTHFLRYGGQVYGFCNAFCRDKTLNDPEAWPDFVEMVNGSIGS